MNQTEITQIVDELRRKHPDTAGDLGDFELTLGLVPAGAVWRVGDLAPAVFALAPGDALFTISLQPSPDGAAAGEVSLSSRPVQSEKLLAQLDWGDYLRVPGEDRWRRTQWAFRYVDQDDDQLEEWQRVSGCVRTNSYPQGLDRDETYARELLARVSRHAVDVGPTEPHEHGPPEEPGPGGDAQGRQQVTDIWGNPLQKGRRRRR